MKRITGLMKNICTMKNALNAYQKARRCKRYRPEVLEFEAKRNISAKPFGNWKV